MPPPWQIVAVAMHPEASGAAQPRPSVSALSTPPAMPADSMTDVSAPRLSYTGRYIAHIAVRRGVASPKQQVRRTDMNTGTSKLLDPSIDGGIASGNYSRPPTISADGARVAFSSTASRLVAGDTNGRNDAFVHDASTDTTLLASGGLSSHPANGDTGMAALSKNGRYVAFTSSATNVVAGSTTTNPDVFLRDLQTNSTMQVSVRPDGSPSRAPAPTAPTCRPTASSSPSPTTTPTWCRPTTTTRTPTFIFAT